MKHLDRVMVGSLTVDCIHETIFHIKQQNAHTFDVDVLAEDGTVTDKATIKMNWKIDHPVVSISVEGFGDVKSDVMQLFHTNEMIYDMQYHGNIFAVNAMTIQQARVAKFIHPPVFAVNNKQLMSPMPGVIVDISIKVGDTVVMGEDLLTLEAMKMRNRLQSEVDGKIKSISVQVGDSVADDALLIEFE